ncbi:lytic transglycosylase domain-containing protein [Bdellovibrio sp. HCB337]|uniref:lytic transglycosylase domain-containing protein n=1 Tax=Bdellovibrio sp. HCB337 TaxID=3394358 RepID=UPI0039A56D07
MMRKAIFLIISLLFFSSLVDANTKCCCEKKLTKDTTRRLQHAKELLGSGFQQSHVSLSAQVPSVKKFIGGIVQERLETFGKKYAHRVTNAIISESKKQGLDPVFVLAVIETESQFDPKVVGSHGEIGLMQIKPDTAQWIAQKNGYTWKGKESLKNPQVNIRIGVAYLAFLRQEFDGLAHQYVAAYNMGPGGVRRLASLDIKPKDYSTRVMTNYYDFYDSLLAKEYN